MVHEKLLHDPAAAALWHAIALRRLHNYRSARRSAEMHGDDLSGLLDPRAMPTCRMRMSGSSRITAANRSARHTSRDAPST